MKKDRAHDHRRVVKIDGKNHEFYHDSKGDAIVHHKNGKDYDLGKESLSEAVIDAKDWHKRNPGT
jgi:hypothetical protein